MHKKRSDQLDNDDTLNLTKTLSLIELFGKEWDYSLKKTSVTYF